MRSKEVETAEALNQHLVLGWKLIRAFESETNIRFLIAKDDKQEEMHGGQRSKDNSGV